MNVTLSNLLFGTTLFACALTTACTGGDEPTSTPGALHASSSGSSGEAGSAPSSEPSSSTGSASEPDAGTTTPTTPTTPTRPTRTLAVQCQGPQAPDCNAVCLETAEGRAGDIVELEVHLLRTASCGPAEYAMGAIQVDPAKFEIMNPDSRPDCLERAQVPSFSDPTIDVISWQAFDRSVAPADCTASAGVGKVDTIEVRIKPGTPAGDYELPFETSELLGGGPGCSGVFLDVAGKIRVLP